MFLRHQSAAKPAKGRKTRKPRKVVPLWRRPEAVPKYWRVVDDAGLDSIGRNLPGPDTKTMELWRLSLEARSVPHLVVGHGHTQRLFVPPLWEGLARSELACLMAENFPGEFSVLPIRHNAHWAVLALLVLVSWHGLISGWWALPVEHMPEPEHWLSRGRLDVFRVLVQGEWWRLVTSLSLHADGLHLFNNVLFGLPLLVLMSRRLGLGLALGLSLLAGISGNLLNVFYQPPQHISVGFSTALFGMLGVLSGDLAVRNRSQSLKRRVFLPLAAALGLLAMLGVGGERTDYAAHAFGLASGYVLGLFTGQFVYRWGRLPRFLEFMIGLAVPLTFIWCWRLAL